MDESISTASAEEEEKPKLKATGHVFQVRLIRTAESTRLADDKVTFLPIFAPCVPSSPSQALQYLRKLCNHPSLVLSPQHPEFKRITEELAAQSSGLRDIQHAPKLSALKQVKFLLRLARCRLGATEVKHRMTFLRVSVLSCCWTAVSVAGQDPRGARRPWWRSTASSSSVS